MKLLFKKPIYTLGHQTKYLHVRKLISLFITNIYLAFSCLEMYRRVIQTKVTKMFLLCLKRKDSQTFKKSSCKKLSTLCVGYWYNLLRWMFFTPCDNWNTSFFINVFCCFVVFLTAMLLLSLTE